MGFAAWGPSRREYEVPLSAPDGGGAEGPAGAAGRPLRRRWGGAGAWKVCSLTFGCLLALACLARPPGLDKLHTVYTEWFVRLRSAWLDDSVTEVDAAEFRPSHFDAVLDVRHADEYASNAPGSCSIVAEDREGCSYGHVPGAIWAPELFQCGACSPEGGLDCSAERQEHVDAKILSGHREPRNLSVALSACRRLRVAFICHSGVRSSTAAKRYAALLAEAFPDRESRAEVISVRGGTRDWFRLGRPTEFGLPHLRPNLTCAGLALWESAAL
mmetsp:Transcript_54887/g.139110  ORF Transcript_54887/g.139110 Transcript_54887/m.139110 type:complete len:272 (+) Transcript_54887:58-873(+)